VAGFVTIRADFHQPIKNVAQEIIITPKMSFGTGHHATTYMMIEQMKEINFQHKDVLDFGTGTGVLAILAEKLGAQQIVAIDNDNWSIDNAEENCRKNNCRTVKIQKAGEAELGLQFDIILANINKNVILDNFSSLAGQLNKGGILLVSGLLKGDEDDVFRRLGEYSLHLIQTTVRNNWLCMRISC
jgi:ribosomal protein L11 methyltransferase